MAEKLGEVLGTIISFVLIFAGAAILTGTFVGIAAGCAARVFGMF